MPFKNAAQERAIFANAPEVARKWVHKYGHAPGFKKKKRKRRNTRSRGEKKS